MDGLFNVYTVKVPIIEKVFTKTTLKNYFRGSQKLLT